MLPRWGINYNTASGGVVMMMTSDYFTACSMVANRSSPIVFARRIDFSLDGNFAPINTVCPDLMNYCAKAPPTFPVPIIAMFILISLS